MSTNKRSGNKWTVKEFLDLQREYELLEWSIQEIAEKHQRSIIAILFKLESECLIDSWETARGYSVYAVVNEEEQDEDEDQDEYEEEEDCCSEENFCESKTTKLTRRVANLENNMKELTIAVNKLCDNIISNKTSNKQFSQDY
jgi:predicted RNase H-like nuclease (RuvC/YqgF family)